MTEARSLYECPIHLGLGARAIPQPLFTGMEWYEDYARRNEGDLDEGRLVSLYRFEKGWDMWEMHPAGDEVVCVVQGRLTLHQQLPDGSEQSLELGPGDYAINGPGVWHTADAEEPVVALFITAGKGTEHRPR